jgi:hypothetical protein
MKMVEMDVTELELFRCPYCQLLVETYWMKDGSGMISTPGATLVADWVYHSKCWDKQMDEHPPMYEGHKGEKND